MSERRVAKVLVALGLVAALLMLFVRVKAERVARNVELVLDLADARTVAQAQGIPLETYLRQMAEAGITSAGVNEATLQDLVNGGYIYLLQGSEVRSALELSAGSGSNAANPSAMQRTLRALGQDAFHPGLYYAVAPEADFGGWLAEQLTRKLPVGAARLVTPPGQSPAVVEVAVTEEQVEKFGVGILPDQVELVARAGLAVVPRLENARDLSDYYIPQALETAAAGNKAHSPGGYIHTVIFNGKQVLGYPDKLDVMASEMKRRGLVLGMIEASLQLGFVDQAGLTDLAESLDYQAVRVYSIGRVELDKYTAADALERQVRSVKERDIRVLYVRPILVKIDQVDRAGENLKYVQQLAAGIRQLGFNLGPAVPFAPVHPNRILLALMALGILAGGMLLLQDMLPLPTLGRRDSKLTFYGLLAVTWIASSGLLLFSGGGLVRKVLALAAALIFPTLGALWAAGFALRVARGKPGLPTLLMKSAQALLGAALISLIAAAFVGALLGGDSRYMLEIEYFRGVKTAVTLPMILTVWVLVHRFGIRPSERSSEAGSHDLLHEAAWLSRQPVFIWHLALMAVGAVGLYIYIGRTGHTAGLSVSSAEIQARDMVERLMVIRPRTKEFLVGYPSLMLAVWAAVRHYRDWLIYFLVGGAIGLASLVNSFEHLRTEFLVSLWRTGNGLLLGLLIGGAAIVALELVWCWLEKRWRSAEDA